MGAATSLLIDQAAELLGVSRRTVYYRIHEGRLQTIRARCGSQRVLVVSVEALLRERYERRSRAPRSASEPPSSVDRGAPCGAEVDDQCPPEA
jgi:excisionase family DNA binding protein